MGNSLDITLSPGEYFHLHNGRVLKNLYELLNALKSMDDDTFEHHVNSGKNDFGNWIKYVFKDYELAEQIYEFKSREDIKNPAPVNEPPAELKKELEALSEPKQLPNAEPAKQIEQRKKLAKLNGKSSKPDFFQFRGANIDTRKMEEILTKEMEIMKREEKIQQIEEHIEKELEKINDMRQPKFFSKEFVQGLVIGLLTTLIVALIYFKMFA